MERGEEGAVFIGEGGAEVTFFRAEEEASSASKLGTDEKRRKLT